MDSPLNIYMYAVALTYASAQLCTPAPIGTLSDTTSPPQFGHRLRSTTATLRPARPEHHA